VRETIQFGSGTLWPALPDAGSESHIIQIQKKNHSLRGTTRTSLGRGRKMLMGQLDFGSVTSFFCYV
jgi:hypothetical protein